MNCFRLFSSRMNSLPHLILTCKPRFGFWKLIGKLQKTLRIPVLSQVLGPICRMLLPNFCRKFEAPNFGRKRSFMPVFSLFRSFSLEKLHKQWAQQVKLLSNIFEIGAYYHSCIHTSDQSEVLFQDARIVFDWSKLFKIDQC